MPCVTVSSPLALTRWLEMARFNHTQVCDECFEDVQNHVKAAFAPQTCCSSFDEFYDYHFGDLFDCLWRHYRGDAIAEDNPPQEDPIGW